VIKRILVGLGGTPYTPVAIERAVALARHHGAFLTAITFRAQGWQAEAARVPGAPATSGDAMRRGQVTGEIIEKAIAAFESACSGAEIPHAVKLETGKPLDLFVSAARYHDLMVLGLRSIFEYDVSAMRPKDELARLVSAGVRPIIAVSQQFRPIQRVLIAYSGSMESAKAMKQFIQLRLWSQVELKIVTFHRSEDRARELLHEASDYCRAHDFHVATEWNPGVPKETLLPLATYWRADMIVMGNSARGLLLRKTLGETSLHLIRSADRPLFLSQ
jgi:nucleotide-binding universal stress UspA family protein